MKIYYVSHKMKRTSAGSIDADAICERVNDLTASNGDSMSRDAVKAALDECASADVQSMYGIRICLELHDTDPDCVDSENSDMSL